MKEPRDQGWLWPLLHIRADDSELELTYKEDECVSVQQGAFLLLLTFG